MILFPARWPGTCDSCGEPYEEGDDIGYLEGYGRPVCRACWEDDQLDEGPDF